MTVEDLLATHWVAALAGALGVVTGAVMTVVGGTWRARGMLATLEEQDAAAKTAIENLKKQIEDLKVEVEDMRDQIRHDTDANNIRHQENTKEIHRIANAVQALPTNERFNRLEDRMMDFLKQALTLQPVSVAHRRSGEHA